MSKFKPPSVTTGADGKRIEIYGWTKTCKYCGKHDLRWVGTTDKDTGTKKWALEEKDSTTASGVRVHRCPAYAERDKAREAIAAYNGTKSESASAVSAPKPSQENYGEW